MVDLGFRIWRWSLGSSGWGSRIQGFGFGGGGVFRVWRLGFRDILYDQNKGLLLGFIQVLKGFQA